MFFNAGTQLQNLIKSPLFLAVASSWLSAQFVKTVIKLFSGKIHSFPELFEYLFWRTGSMPSSHSSVVASVCTCIGFSSGFSSDVFILALVLYLITIRDAVGVRRSNGIQSRRLNEISELLKEKGLSEDFKKIKEVNGHSPMEVFVGSLLGLFIGVAFSVL